MKITGAPAKAGTADKASTRSAPAAAAPAAASGAPAAAAPRPGTPATAPKATTGTPAPPSSPSPSAATSALKLAADPGGQLSYDTKQLSAKAGKVTITFANSAPLEHDVTIAEGSTVLGATPIFQGGSKTLTLSLKPGTYTFYCSVPGHRQAGMEGTLSVS
jgi:plastocyanin